MKSVGYEIVIFFMLLIAVGMPAFADLYQYRDENGVLVFTDDFSRLTDTQRAQSKKFNEIKSDPVNITQSSPQDPSSENETKGISDLLMQEANALIRENKKLNQDYAVIVEENKNLANLRKKLQLKKNISRSELDSFNKRVEDMNRKAKEYDSLLKAHQDRTKAYNLKLDRVKKAAKTHDGD